MSFKSLKISSYLFLTILLLLTATTTKAQLYSHNFGTATISSHPYIVAPGILNPNLSNSSWTNSTNAWTSTTGSAGQAIRLTASSDATITLTMNVGANYKAAITSFSFWTQRSNLGPANWSMAINGINVGSGAVATNGTSTGNTAVSSAISGLTGTINIVISLTGGTGTGTFRLDDFILNGSTSLNCTAATISNIMPVSGPQNTLVAINGSGFQTGSGTSAVQFNGIPSVFNVISDTRIEAYVPAGNASGNITVITGGCPGVSAMTFTKIISDVPTNYSSDIYISEIHDVGTTQDGGIGGSGGIIEIYNGTASTVNLAGYSVKRYGDIGDATPSITPLNLVGSIPAGGIFLLGLPRTSCTENYDQTFNTGFNENDEFELLKNGVIIDNVHLVFTRSGFSIIRKPDAVAPKAIFNSNDWNGNDLESCANIGIHNVAVPSLPTVTNPVSKTICENSNVSFSAPLSNPAGYTFQWKILNTAGTWLNVVNNAQYSGATTNTLTINSVPASLDKSQFYCQMTSGTKTVVSNAAQLEVTPTIIPDFPTTLSFCSGENIAPLNTTSPNGIIGIWSPSIINNRIGGNYTFTPNAGQCAENVILNVAINSKTIPDFATNLPLCAGQTAPPLIATSPNGISGIWSPAIINNTTDGTYTFTPNVGECAENVVLRVTIANQITPDFSYGTTYCENDAVPLLAITSPNGISGTWSPAIMSNTRSGRYTFTPNAGQCAINFILDVTITSKIVPDFPINLTVCNGGNVPILASISPNGIRGTWNPSLISNTSDGVYTFTPDAGQCATNRILSVRMTNQIIPDFLLNQIICNGDTAPPLGTTSPNGITGTWNPATISNTVAGSYLFTPDAGQCATNFRLNVAITNSISPNFAQIPNICEGGNVPILATVSPNGISGTWSPAAINNMTGGRYTFTPNAGQCASTQILDVHINSRVIPGFSYGTTYCESDAVPLLATTSSNGISGTWSPAVISNTRSGRYTFTPNAGQCAINFILDVTITSKIVPDFPTTLTVCNGGNVPTLALISPNGISGTWSPATISNIRNERYTFTPNIGQCASNSILDVTITSKIIPDFPTTLTICSGGNVPVLASISPNGIRGTWNPSAINNTLDGTYTFTPDAGQCASLVIFKLIINNGTLTPILGANAVCESNTIQLTNATPAGIWSSSNTAVATVDNNGIVTAISAGSVVIKYSLTSGNCNASVSKNIIINSLPKPLLKDKFICIDSQTGAVISRAELNTGITNLNHSFYWTLNNQPLPTLINTHFANEPGIYKVVVTNLTTGCSSEATAVVKVSLTAVATATIEEDFNRNQIITVNVSGGSGDYEFQLNDGLPQESNQFTGYFSGEYEIIVRDKNGCQEVILEVLALNYPRYFTPNGDGYHDTWNVDSLADQTDAKIYIFDRYGKLLKYITPSTSGWDGTFNGQILPSTDYWFKLLYRGRNGNEKEFKAHFSMKR